MSFICKANLVLLRFRCTTPQTKIRFQAYCLLFYGCPLWRFDCDKLKSLSQSFNNVLRKIWSLPRKGHTSFVHSVASLSTTSSTIDFLIPFVLLCLILPALSVLFLMMKTKHNYSTHNIATSKHQCTQWSLRYGQNLRGAFLRATLPMTVGSCARVMADNGETKWLITPPPRLVSAQLLYVCVIAW